jgi:KH/beta-lactamase-domain protein
MDDTNAPLDAVREQLDAEVPDHIDITEVQYEGPELVVYTETPREFAAEQELVGRLARTLRVRLSIRPAPGTRTEQREAEARIRDIIPDESGITRLQFYPVTGEVLIEAEKPGLVIGRGGSTLQEITSEIGWSPEVLRTPPMESSTVDNVRNFLTEERAERKEFLRRTGNQIHRDVDDPEWVRITTLGCCREVGRASFVLSTQNSRILVDCGDKPGAEGEVPYLQAAEANPIPDLDAVVLTHAHLDHSALLPILFRYGYDGPVYTTAPTRDLMGLLQLDYLDVAAKQGRTPPYDSEMVREEIKRTITLEYGDVTDIAPDIKLTLHNAGHILGSALAHFHIGSGMHNVLFTGDIHYSPTRLLDGAVNDFPRVETMVLESTYGRRGNTQTAQEDSERRLYELINETHEAGGKVVIPAFAVGRSQELMLVLEEGMRTGAIPEMPVYLDGMIREATAIHTAYPKHLRERLQNRILHEDENPFITEQFQQVDGGREMRQRITDGEECIILSTSGMVTGGPIMSWLELLGSDPKNSLVFVGYQADGTLGRRIQSGWTEVPLDGGGQYGSRVTLECRIESVDGFSGHADREALMSFADEMSPRPERVLCVHGDETATNQLSSAIYQKHNIKTNAPKNLETYRLD